MLSNCLFLLPPSGQNKCSTVMVILHCCTGSLPTCFHINTLHIFRLLQMRTVVFCCIKGTMITLPWSCTGGASGSATTLDLTLHLLYTGTCTSMRKCLQNTHWCHMFRLNLSILSLCSLSVETVNDGSFHAVELVASDQTLSLSIDGGPPKSINSISKQSTLNIDSPLYLGGMDQSLVCLSVYVCARARVCVCVCLGMNDSRQKYDRFVHRSPQIFLSAFSEYSLVQCIHYHTISCIQLEETFLLKQSLR